MQIIRTGFLIAGMRGNEESRERGSNKLSKRSRGRPPRPWTEAELALLGTRMDTVIAEMIGVSTSAVFKKRQKLSIPAMKKPGRPRAVDTKRRQYIVEAVNAGKTLAQVGLELGISRQRVGELYRLATNRTLRHRKGWPRRRKQ